MALQEGTWVAFRKYWPAITAESASGFVFGTGAVGRLVVGFQWQAVGR